MREQVVDVDSADAPDLLSLAEQVRSTGQRLVLRRHNEPIAAVVPVRRRSPCFRPSPADIAASKAAAGGWKGLVDSRKLKRDVYAARGTDRPPVDL
jgi:antitoxin (DNA-binding transcriptional repressor) of toxin-antitoxin stability system